MSSFTLNDTEESTGLNIILEWSSAHKDQNVPLSVTYLFTPSVGGRYIIQLRNNITQDIVDITNYGSW